MNRLAIFLILISVALFIWIIRGSVLSHADSIKKRKRQQNPPKREYV
jgi:hypothetical protein